MSFLDKKENINVFCIGDSCTARFLISDVLNESYPSQLGILLGRKHEVKNFGHSEATLLKKGHNPYYKTKECVGAITHIDLTLRLFI